MTLGKAIELLNENSKYLKEDGFHDHADAVKLGIEALKLLDDFRNHRQFYIYSILPGETEK